MADKILFNDGWSFSKQPLGTTQEALLKKDITWSEVDIPHDWLIYNTEDLYEAGEGWYKKSFPMEELSDRIVLIYFEGVYMNSTVYVNGQVVGEWKYGYTSFEFDISKYLKQGNNEIMVRVVHQSPNSRWYSGAGIYRNVWLRIKRESHLVTDGIYISTVKAEDGWFVEVETEVISKKSAVSLKADINTGKGGTAEEKSEGDKLWKAYIRHTILDMEGNVATIARNLIELHKDVTTIDKQRIMIKEPELWSLEKPYLYSLKTELIVDDVIVDEELQGFGFRTLRFDCNEGFFLNDKYVKLHGVCQHHDLGALGAAVNRTAIKRQLLILKEMGVNAIRTSHNSPAVELMELADEMGILIVSECFDMWEKPKTEYDYARYFNEWCEKDVAGWIRRDRNHPSIIMWSIGNEIYDTHAGPRGLEITRQLKELVLLHDPKRNGRVTIGSNYMAWENAQKCAEELDVAGYNYAENLYEEHHKKYPHWVIYGSETASTLQSRGIYHFPANKVVVTHEDEQCSSLDNCTTVWGAKNTQKVITDDRDAKFCLGQFIWTGFDYIGEPTPYTTKNSYFGQIDTAGFKKDSFYLYQAEWTDYRTNPMVHILPYWDFNVGQLIDIRIYSNAPKTELFFNEQSLGCYDIDHVKGKELSGKWQIPYEPGTIKAVAYDEADNVIATDSRSSFGDAVKILLKPDKTSLKADGQDMIFMEISVEDKNGIPVANANNRIEVEVSGAGRLLGLDNGDSTDYDQYKGTSRRLFSGKLLAIIAAKTVAGDIRVKVSSRGLPTEELMLNAIPSDVIPRVTALTENIQSEPKDEIPIRKIELTLHGSKHLNPSNPVVTIDAKLLPENTTYQEIEWKVVNNAGVQTNIARIDVEGKKARLTALGDGELRLRCTAKNGGPSSRIISELEFEISGMGNVTMNPYELVDAGLYNASNHEMDPGLLGGVTSKEGMKNHIGFRGLDFGDIGSDELTIPINYWSNEPLALEIWEGMPGEEDAELLLDTHYQAELVWNTFQPNTFKLPKKLKGITTLCLVLSNRANIKGFQFTKTEKAFERLYAKDNDRLYGDSFIITEEAIEHIGNNVSIEFEAMDFGNESFSRLIICGRSHTEVNTIHIRFSDSEGNVNQIAEFPYSDDYTEREFVLQPVKGKQKVTFVFLPGSNFDFKWFRFVR